MAYGLGFCGLALVGLLCSGSIFSAQVYGADLASMSCSNAKDVVNPPFCKAVRGDRAEGWLAQGRSEVMARNGMVTTSQPLATEAGLAILRRGGNAIDAAVATAAALGLVEPMKTGMAGDLFAIIYTAKDHKLHVLNASGMAASGQSLSFMNEHGYKFTTNNGPGSGMPRAGALTVTVPGSLWGWQEVLDKYGTMNFKQVLQPAIDYAEQGFPISERIASDWFLPKAVGADPASSAGCCTALDPDSVRNWYVDGNRPKAGQIFRNPDMAKTLRILQERGRDGFYKGEIAKAIVAKVHALGGTMTLDDLANYHGEWVEPVMTEYHGYFLAEVPPPSQGFAANEMLNIVQACVGVVYPGQSLASLGPSDPRYWHMLVEAKKLAYSDLNKYNGDPNFNPGLVEKVRNTFLSPEYARSQCGKIDPAKASRLETGNASGDGDTIVLSTADRWGNMVSWVNSLFANFGSGVTVPGYGLILHNRGALFTLDPQSPNVIAPHKRPYNTLAAGFVLQNGKTDGQLMTMLLMGGDMQAQGHAQMMVNMIDLGANLQASTDMARFHHNQIRNQLQLESQLYETMGPQLKAMGHNVMSVNGSGMGGYQALLFTPDAKEGAAPRRDQNSKPVNGVYRAGTDHRKDGISAGW